MAILNACHCFIKTVHHLGSFLKKIRKGSLLGDIHMKRTKCSKLITHVIIAPSLFNEITADLHDGCYSLIADKNTDAASTKNLCSHQYFSKSKNKVETSLLGMAEVVSATEENLFEALESLTDRAHLQLENCIGLGTDGVSNMIGQHNSLFSRLKEVSPHCILIHCICHSLAICI